MLMQRVEMGEQLIATDLSCGVHQPRLKNEQGNDLVVGRSCGCPRGVVVEAKVSPEPHHARSRINTCHRASMNQAQSGNAVGPGLVGADDTALESNGGFWLDRRPRSTHKLRSTRTRDTTEFRARTAVVKSSQVARYRVSFTRRAGTGTDNRPQGGCPE